MKNPMRRLFNLPEETVTDRDIKPQDVLPEAPDVRSCLDPDRPKVRVRRACLECGAETWEQHDGSCPKRLALVEPRDPGVGEFMRGAK